MRDVREIFQCVAVCCFVLLCVAVRCSMLQCLREQSVRGVCENFGGNPVVPDCVLQRVALCCGVLQCVAVCCSVTKLSVCSACDYFAKDLRRCRQFVAPEDTYTATYCNTLQHATAHCNTLQLTLLQNTHVLF